MIQNIEQVGGQSSLYTPDQVVDRLEGGLNWTTVITKGSLPKGEWLAVRRPKPLTMRLETDRNVRNEYAAVGASALGIDFRLRTLEEQRDFMDLCTSLGLQALECEQLVEGELVTKFVKGRSLSNYVADSSQIKSDTMNDVLAHLAKAHSMGIVFGDRWAMNTIITPEEDHVEIDFDIELKGEHSTMVNFELAQTLYHLLHFANSGREKIVDMIGDIYKDTPHILSGYNQTQMKDFIEGQGNYFYRKYREEGELYEGTIPPSPNNEVRELNDLLGSVWKFVPEGPITNSLPRPKVNE